MKDKEDRALNHEECPRCSHKTLKWNREKNCNVCENEKCGWNDGEIITSIPLYLLVSFLNESTNRWERGYFEKLIEAVKKMELEEVRTPA